MEYLLASAVVIILAGALFAKRYSDKQRTVHRSSQTRKTASASTASDVDSSRAKRRAEDIASRPKKDRVQLTVIGDERTPVAAETYRAAYELIVRGIDVQLDMADVWRERGGRVCLF